MWHYRNCKNTTGKSQSIIEGVLRIQDFLGMIAPFIIKFQIGHFVYGDIYFRSISSQPAFRWLIKLKLNVAEKLIDRFPEKMSSEIKDLSITILKSINENVKETEVHSSENQSHQRI